MPRLMTLKSPLGADAIPVRLAGSETLGRAFEFRLEFLSTRADISARQLLGQPMIVEIAAGDGRKRHFSGHCTQLRRGTGVGGYAQYEAVLRPALWFLTRNADCRVFQDMSVPDIVKQVISEGFGQRVEERLSGSYAPWKYCVQYRESDFNFVSRLLEQEGIYYQFTHDASGHTMVLCDSKSAHPPIDGGPLPYRPSARAAETMRDHIESWQQVREYPFHGYALNEYHYTSPSADRLLVRRAEGLEVDARFELYDYPGEFDAPEEGERYVGARIEEVFASSEVFEGAGQSFSMAPGRKFRLVDHPVREFETDYLATSVAFECVDPVPQSGEAEGSSFEVSFVAMPASRQFRAPRTTPKPSIHGVQTATVVGPSGEEIYTDPEGLGRVKVQFHWDRHGRRNEQSSCWVRVATPWANQNFGFVAIPRIGSEVVVAFEEGDPDRPLIVASVYNSENKPPYRLPDHKTQSGLKTKSSKGAGATNFNELRFEDKKGDELIFVQAEKDQRVLVKHDRILHVRNDAHERIGRDAFSTIAQKSNVKIGSDLLSDVQGSVHEKIGQDLMTKAGMRINAAAGQEIHLKAGMNVTVEAGTLLTLKVGGNFISINPAGIFVQGTMVMINSGGAAGSGSGVSLRAPAEAARNDEGAAIAAVAPRPPRPPRPARPGPTAQALADSANTGMPFCRQCGC